MESWTCNPAMSHSPFPKTTLPSFLFLLGALHSSPEHRNKDGSWSLQHGTRDSLLFPVSDLYSIPRLLLRMWATFNILRDQGWNLFSITTNSSLLENVVKQGHPTQEHYKVVKSFCKPFKLQHHQSAAFKWVALEAAHLWGFFRHPCYILASDIYVEVKSSKPLACHSLSFTAPVPLWRYDGRMESHLTQVSVVWSKPPRCCDTECDFRFDSVEYIKIICYCVCVCECGHMCVPWHVYVDQTSAFWGPLWPLWNVVVSVMRGLSKHALQEIWDQINSCTLLRARNANEWEITLSPLGSFQSKQRYQGTEGGELLKWKLAVVNSHCKTQKLTSLWEVQKNLTLACSISLSPTSSTELVCQHVNVYKTKHLLLFKAYPGKWLPISQPPPPSTYLWTQAYTPLHSLF